MSVIFLNAEIFKGEVLKVVEKAKISKATGIEDIPNEMLKSPKLTQLLYNYDLNLSQTQYQN